MRLRVPYFRESIVLFTARTVPAVTVSIRYFRICVTKPAVHCYRETWPERCKTLSRKDYKQIQNMKGNVEIIPINGTMHHKK